MVREDPLHILARAVGTIRSRDEIARELIDVVEELLYDVHTWSNGGYPGEEDVTESTEGIISRAENVLERAKELFFFRRTGRAPKTDENEPGGT